MGVMKHRRILSLGVATAVAGWVGGCGNSGETGDSITAQDDVGIAYVQRSNNLTANPTDARANNATGDLYIKEKSAPASAAKNITGAYTDGAGDVSDPEVSYDGNKIIFSMRCGAASAAACRDPYNEGTSDTSWNVWEYDRTTGQMRRIMQNNAVSRLGDDIDPAYLPGNAGIVFSSNRQTKSSAMIGYRALDEYERETVANLHVMTLDGQTIEQIGFNQSHDRNPTVLMSGEIMFARWDHVSGRNHFAIFITKPDGTGMFVKYGSHSPGNSFLHPREMPDGRVMSSLMPLSGTNEGGALMVIDVANFTENNSRMTRLVTGTAQRQATAEPLNFGRGLSERGRITTPHPLWDGTPRALVAFNPCQVRDNHPDYSGQIIPCALAKARDEAQFNRLGQDNRLNTDVAGDRFSTNVPPAYSIQMVDMSNGTLRTVVPAKAGFIYTDPIPLQARAQPNNLGWAPRSGTTAILDVRSVYDTDENGRMGLNNDNESGSGSLLLAAELAGFPRMNQSDNRDIRDRVADIAQIKDPLNPYYLSRPGRYLRVTRAVAPRSGAQGAREAIGETEAEMQQILGYTDVEPDGSIFLEVPADTPIGITVLDEQGRAVQSHTNWIQGRPGETVFCKGCHSPRNNSNPLNGPGIIGSHTGPQYRMAGQQGESMAMTRARVAGRTAMALQPDIEFSDVWANTSAGATALPCKVVRYTGNVDCTSGNPDPANDLQTPAPVNGIINYPEHIQPIWNRARSGPGGEDWRCVACHTDTVRLSLLGTTSGTGRLTSYQELLVGDPLLDANGNPITVIRDGELVVERGPALVSNAISESEAGGITRKSRLGEILYGQDMRASADARARFPTPAAPDHGALLNKAEKRLVTEWMDLSGQYMNDINAAPISGLSETVFAQAVHPILMSTCAGCHQPGGSDPDAPPNFNGNRFVLTGAVEGDFNVTLSLIDDTCQPDQNPILAQPSQPHPVTAATPVVRLPAAPAPSDYATIAAWILGGCPAP